MITNARYCASPHARCAARTVPALRTIVLAAMLVTGRVSLLQAQSTGDDLVARLDSATRAGLQRDRIGEAAFVVVRGNSRIARGFGTTRGGEPVDPAETLFGLASTTKLLTALAAARLVGSGALDLDAPIARYLTPSPLLSDGRLDGVTMAMLLTHSAGYDDPTVGSAATTASARISLERYLDRHLRPPDVQPGMVASYSNIGYALAGHVLARIAGAPYERVVDSLVLQPAGLAHTSVEQPLPGNLEQFRARAAFQGSDVPRLYFNDAPADAGFATANDMGRLLSSLVLPSSASDSALAARALALLFRNHPDLPGSTMAFRQGNTLPASYLHGGSWQDYANVVVIVPTRNAAFFAAFSSRSGGRLGRELTTLFTDALQATPAPPYSAETPAVPDCRDIRGFYRDMRQSHASVARLGILTGNVRELRVVATEEGLDVSGRKYRRTAPTTFRDSAGAVGLRCDGDRAIFLFRSESPTTSFRRVPRWQNRTLLALALILNWTLLTILGSAELRSWHRRRKLGAQSPSGVARPLAAVGISIYVLAVALALATADQWAFQFGIPTAPRTILSFSWFLIPAAIVAVVGTVPLLASPAGGRRIRDSIVPVATCVLLITMLAQLEFWNLMPMWRLLTN